MCKSETSLSVCMYVCVCVVQTEAVCMQYAHCAKEGVYEDVGICKTL